MLSGGPPETLHRVEDAVRRFRHYCSLLNQPSSAFPNFSFSETGSLMLLWPYWACANTAQGNSTKRQHLLWVYPTERTETRLHFFYLFVIFHDFFFMLLGSYSFLKITNLCIRLENWTGFVNKKECMYSCQNLQFWCLSTCLFACFF